MASQPLKLYYDRSTNLLLTADGSAIHSETLLPFAILGMVRTVNLQVVSDTALTAYTGYAAGCSACVLVDNDYSNYAPLIDLEAGDGNWTAGTGSEYYYAETDDLTAKPAYVYLNGAVATEGTVGALSAGTWGWATGTGRLYVRLSDSTDPDTKTDGYVEYVPEVTTTKPFIEVDSGTVNAAGSWYDEGWRNPDITDGEISFDISANTAQFYNRLGTSEKAAPTCVMQVQILEVGTSAFIDLLAFSFICRNRFLPSGAELNVEITNYYTKAESDALFATLVGAVDIEITDATKGVVFTSPDGTQYRLTVDNSGSPVITAI